MGKIIVLGSINMDVVVTGERLPKPGETIFGDELHFIPGGKGSNQAVAAGRLGGQVQLIGRLGEDAFGGTLRDFLDGEPLDLTHLGTVRDAPTGTALITVDAASENTIVVVSGANMTFTPDDVAGVPISAGDILVSQFEVPQPAIAALFGRAREAGAATILNTAPAGPFIDGLQEQVTHLVVNETELAYFAGMDVTDDVDALAKAARSIRTPGQTVIVTLGRRGLAAIVGDEVIRVEGHDVPAVDTTGAGDCFVGGLAVGLSEGLALADALAFANKAASISVQRLGAATSLPRRDEVDGA